MLWNSPAAPGPVAQTGWIARVLLPLALLALLLPAAAPAVDGVVEINAAAAAQGGVTPGDTAGFPVTLSRSGSYRLTGNLTTNSRSLTLIEITAPRVSLDLNGFLVGVCPSGGLCGATGTADAIESFETETRIHGGTVIGASGACVRASTRAVLSDLIVERCENGIVAGNDVRIEGVTVSGADSVGVFLGASGLIRDSTITGSGALAVSMAANGLVVDTVFRNNAFVFGGSSSTATSPGYRGCLITLNGPNEVQPISPQYRNLGGNVCGSDTFCP